MDTRKILVGGACDLKPTQGFIESALEVFVTSDAELRVHGPAGEERIEREIGEDLVVNFGR